MGIRLNFLYILRETDLDFLKFFFFLFFYSSFGSFFFLSPSFLLLFSPCHPLKWVFGAGCWAARCWEKEKCSHVNASLNKVILWASAFWLFLFFYRNPPFFFLPLTHIFLNWDLAITLLRLLIKSSSCVSVSQQSPPVTGPVVWSGTEYGNSKIWDQQPGWGSSKAALGKSPDAQLCPAVGAHLWVMFLQHQVM